MVCSFQAPKRTAHRGSGSAHSIARRPPNGMRVLPPQLAISSRAAFSFSASRGEVDRLKLLGTYSTRWLRIGALVTSCHHSADAALPMLPAVVRVFRWSSGMDARGLWDSSAANRAEALALAGLGLLICPLTRR